jgi:serine/threonine-protein kinase RsbW
VRDERRADRYSLLLDTSFNGATIAAVRHEVRAAADRCHMTDDDLDDFLVAVNEVMTNAVRHGGGAGRLRLWRDGVILCEVIDQGQGFNPRPHLQHRPQPSATGGMGLWLARQTSHDLDIQSSPSGTTIKVSGLLDGGS